MNEDESLQFRQLTAQLDLLRMFEANQPWPEISALASNKEAAFETKVRGASAHRLFVSGMTVPRFSGAFRKIATAETRQRLGITAIALKRYELKYGKLPLNLKTLAPEFLSAVPIDPMSGKALCYRLNGDGSFVLYSVGEDGKDDGGDPTPAMAGAQPDLWEGRDAVWPSAASEEEVAKAEAEAAQKAH